MPFKLGEIFAEVEAIPEIYQRIKVLLITERGSVPGDPRYGVTISKYIPYTNDNKPKIISEIMEAIGLYEPEVRVKQIDVRESTVIVTVEGVGAIVV